MPAGNVETYFEGNEWRCRISGDATPFHTTDTKEQAETIGREEAHRRGVEHIIKNKDGTVS